MEERQIKEAIVDFQLNKDREACAKEIAPILAKHNLKLDTVILRMRNGFIAIPEFVRPKKQ